MCIIFTCDSGRPEDDLLEEANDLNDDGAGLAWVDAGKVKWEKGLDVKEVKAMIGDIPFPFMVHFRSASIGAAVPELTHPFPLTPKVTTDLAGSAPAVLMHNGHWGAWKEHLRNSIITRGLRAPNGLWSDSRAIAFLVQHHGPGILPIILDSDRIAILNGKKDMLIWGEWFQHKGFKASVNIHTNHRWKRDEPKVTTISNFKAEHTAPKPQAPDRTTPTQVHAAHNLVALPPGAFTLEEIASVLSATRSAMVM